MKPFTKRLPASFKKGISKITTDTKNLSEYACSSKAPSIRHTYSEEISFFSTGKDTKPCLTLSANGTYRVSVFKLALIILCVISAFMMLTRLVESLNNRRRRRKTKHEVCDFCVGEEFCDEPSN